MKFTLNHEIYDENVDVFWKSDDSKPPEEIRGDYIVRFDGVAVPIHADSRSGSFTIFSSRVAEGKYRVQIDLAEGVGDPPMLDDISKLDPLNFSGLKDGDRLLIIEAERFGSRVVVYARED